MAGYAATTLDMTDTGTWASWNGYYTVDCTSTAGVWTLWNTTYTATSTMTNDVVWVGWMGSSSDTVSYRPRAVPQLTPEQVAENQRKAEERARKNEAIAKRAEALLKAHLSEEQKESYEKERRFDVISGTHKRRYRIQHGVVYELNAQGQNVRSFCIHPREAFHEADNMLAKKLMLEAEEDEFLRIANATRLRAA